MHLTAAEVVAVTDRLNLGVMAVAVAVRSDDLKSDAMIVWLVVVQGGGGRKLRLRRGVVWLVIYRILYG